MKVKCVWLLIIVVKLFAVEGIKPSIEKPNPESPQMERFVGTSDIIQIIRGNSTEAFSKSAREMSLDLQLGRGLKGGVNGIIGKRGEKFTTNLQVSAENYRDFSGLVNVKSDGEIGFRSTSWLVVVDIGGSFIRREFEFWMADQGDFAQRWSIFTSAFAIFPHKKFSLELSTNIFHGTHKNQLNWFPFSSFSASTLFRYYILENLRIKFLLMQSLDRTRDIMNDSLFDHSSFRSILSLGYDINIHYAELGAVFNTTYNSTFASPYIKAIIRKNKLDIAVEYSSEVNLPAPFLKELDPYIIFNPSLPEQLTKGKLNLSATIFSVKNMTIEPTIEYQSVQYPHTFSFKQGSFPFPSNIDKAKKIRFGIGVTSNIKFLTNTVNITYNRYVDHNNYQLPLEPRITAKTKTELNYKGFKSGFELSFTGRQETYAGNFIKPYAIFSFDIIYKWRGFKFGISVKNALNNKFEWYPKRYDTGSYGRLEIGYDIR